MAAFRGPYRYYRSSNRLVGRKDSMIEEATMTIEGRGTVFLDENKISFWIPPNTQNIVEVWHSYDYPLEGGRGHGRWYNTEYPLEHVRSLPESNEFIYTMSNYELNDAGFETGTAIFRIKFKPAAAVKLRAI